jgi:hypothetical protein
MGEFREFSWAFSRHSQIRGIRDENPQTLLQPWWYGFPHLTAHIIYANLFADEQHGDIFIIS